MKTHSTLSAERVRQYAQTRFNPIRNLTPELLSRQLESFHTGRLREAALTWEAIERRDDKIQTVASKRKKSVSRLNWEIITTEDSPEASLHQEILLHFYNHLSVTDAVDRNQQGGVALLIRQMMDAIGKRYAVHEIVWNPQSSSDGTPSLRAELRFVPLWFFENLTGSLRFLPTEYATEGTDLDPGSWLVTCGDGLMEASSVAYMYKHLPMRDWLLYCEKHGMPGVHGRTAAPQGSPEWEAMVDAVSAIAADFSCVTSLDDTIEKIDFGNSGTLPFPELIERMDRAITALWRGGDLGTMSSENGAGLGASLQSGEASLLEQDDAALISDTLNLQIDRWVLRYTLDSEEPKAYFRLNTPAADHTQRDIQIDSFLRESGFPLSPETLSERYGRPLPETPTKE